MSMQLKLLDHFKLLNHLSVNFACGYSEDGRFFILNDIGVYILGFTGLVPYEESNFLCTKFFFNLSNYTPCGNVDLDINSFHPDLSKDDHYELVMKAEYSANLKFTKPIEPAPVYAEWSSKGLVEGHSCLVAVLSNTYSLEIYMKYLNEVEEIQYVCILNLTKEIIKYEHQKWSNAVRFGIQLKLEEYKRRINSVSPSVFTWSHTFKSNEKNAAVIFCGHLNGDISVWRIASRTYEDGVQSVPTFLGRCHTGLKRLTTMYWHRSSQNGGGLFYSDLEGKLNVVHITNLNKNEVIFHKEQTFLNEPDKSGIDKISVMTFAKYTFILIAKQRVLILFGLDQSGNVFDYATEYIQEYYITGLYHFNNKILVLSLPGILTELSIEIKNNKIILEKSLTYLKSDLEKYRTHGFFFTKNMTLCVIIAYPWDMESFTQRKTDVNIFVFHNSVRKPLEILWKNEKGSIEDYWDCIEALRLICLKEKRFPWLGLPANLNYDTLSTTQLKTLRIIAKISEIVFNVIPNIRTYDIKPYILLHYLLEIKLVVERMARLLKQMKKKQLSTFQLRSLFIQNIYLKEKVVEDILPKANVGKTFIDGIRSVMEIANELEYPEPLVCAWCGDKVMGPSCFPPHADSRCCISMMPIFILPEYKCLFCKSVAHKAIKDEVAEVTCPYCDNVMDRIYVNIKKLGKNCENFQKSLPDLKYSDCFEDCLKETIEHDEIEENTVEYIIFSDSDDEPDDIKKLYEQFSKAQVTEEPVENLEDL